MAPKSCDDTNVPSTVDETEELTTESKCIHTAVNHPNQTSPELGPLTKVGEALDDEMAPKSCDATNVPSTIDETEELTTESKCIHTAVNHPNQTSPELGPLTKVGEALDDEMAPKSCDATNVPSTVDETEELTTESKCIHTAVNHPNQTSPELAPLTKVGEAQQSSEDELLSDQDKIPTPELDQISSDEAEDMSDKEYIPDSEDDEYDSDASIPLCQVRCPFKPENEDLDDKPGRTKVLGLAAALESTFCQQISVECGSSLVS
ncbi:uncharacterized protein LOC118496116 [Sander lucioperca]|uniref:uncharacterized protein LOC118496116 n=1 Tax=Sander lucioperca TaxID=283035 RepID=UPI001653E55E|nr:uncharacterized protein LOC118496116 [Sander lucioperca]